MEPNLKDEFQFYLDNQENFVKKYFSKYIVIKEKKVIGRYDSQQEAITKTIKDGNEVGTFLVQQCIKGNVELKYCNSRIQFNENT